MGKLSHLLRVRQSMCGVVSALSCKRCQITRIGCSAARSSRRRLVTGNAVVLGVSLLVWGLVFFYLIRLERRVKELERK